MCSLRKVKWMISHGPKLMNIRLNCVCVQSWKQCVKVVLCGLMIKRGMFMPLMSSGECFNTSCWDLGRHCKGMMLWREENKRGWLFKERNTISDVVVVVVVVLVMLFVLMILSDVSVIEVYSFCDWSKCIID